MADFTPQEIEQFLQQFFDTVGARQYVGARYVPIFGRAGEDTVEWDDLAPYEPLTVVMHQGVSYVSRRYVPAGIGITDTAYWVETYRFNAQVEQYRQEVLGFQGQIDDIRADYVPFPDSDTYPKYGTLGQVLTTLTNGETKWEDPVVPSDAQAEAVITSWLDDHPEATTTVEDGSLTEAKLNDSLANKLIFDRYQFSGSDVNDISENSFYYCASGKAHLPTATGAYMVYTYMPYNDNTTIACQVARQFTGGATYYRRKSNNVWDAWSTTIPGESINEGMLNVSLANRLIFDRYQFSGSDVNDISENSFYYCASGKAHLPTATGAYMVYTYMPYNDNTTIACQVARQFTGGATYYRKKSNDVWDSWSIPVPDGGITSQKLSEDLQTELGTIAQNTDAINNILVPTAMNLYDWRTTKKNTLIDATTGSDVYSGNNDASDFIPIAGDKVTVRDFINAGGSYVYRLYCYNASKEYITRLLSNTGAAQYTFTLPANTAYIRVCISPSSEPYTHRYVIVEGELTLINYYPYAGPQDYVLRHNFSKPRPMLTIIDDDGHLDYKDYLLPFCQSYNVPIASAVTTLRFGGQSTVGRYMTLAEIRECADAGAEILCHSYTHVPDNEDIRRYAVIDGQYVNATTFNDSGGNPVTPENDVTYHDTVSDKYYTYNGTSYIEITNITITDYQKLIDVYTDVSGYATDNVPNYPTKEAYYVDKCTKYYTIARNVLQQAGIPSGDIFVGNNSTAFDPVTQRACNRVFRCCMDYHADVPNFFGQIERDKVHRTSIETHRYSVAFMKGQIDRLVSDGGWVIWVMHTTGNEWRGTEVSPGVMGIGRDAVMANMAEAFDYAHSLGVEIVTASRGCSAYIDGVA